jgi:hypothetical protein
VAAKSRVCLPDHLKVEKAKSAQEVREDVGSACGVPVLS